MTTFRKTQASGRLVREASRGRLLEGKRKWNREEKEKNERKKEGEE